MGNLWDARPRTGVRNALQGRGLGPHLVFSGFRSQGSTPGTRLEGLPERVPTPVPKARPAVGVESEGCQISKISQWIPGNRTSLLK